MRRTIVAAVAVSWLAASSDVVAQGTGEGFRLTLETKTTATGAMAAAIPSGQQRFRLQLRGGVTRTDPDLNPMVPRGTYVLNQVGTRTVRMVDTAARQVTVFTGSEEIGATAGVKMSIVDTATTREDLGAGDTVLGFPTRKFRVTMRYRMQMGDAEHGVNELGSMTTTLHVSEAMAALDPGFTVLRELVMKTPLPIGNGSSEAMEVAMASVFPPGVALAADVETRTSMNGMETVIQQQSRVTEFTRGGVTASALTVPETYTVLDLNKMMQGAMNSAAEAQSESSKPVKPAKSAKPIKPTKR